MSKEERISYWSEKSKLWELSGKSQKDFCKAHNLCLRQFVYWRCNAAKKKRARDFENKLYKVLTPPQVQTFCEQEERLEVLLPDGIKIYISSEIDIKRASSLIKVLGGVR